MDKYLNAREKREYHATRVTDETFTMWISEIDRIEIIEMESESVSSCIITIVGKSDNRNPRFEFSVAKIMGTLL